MSHCQSLSLMNGYLQGRYVIGMSCLILLLLFWYVHVLKQIKQTRCIFCTSNQTQTIAEAVRHASKALAKFFSVDAIPNVYEKCLTAQSRRWTSRSTGRMGFTTRCAWRGQCVASCVALSALVSLMSHIHSRFKRLMTYYTYGSYGKSGWSVIASGFWLDMVVSACDCRRRLLLVDILLISFDHALTSLVIFDVVCFLAEVALFACEAPSKFFSLVPTVIEKSCTAQGRSWTCHSTRRMGFNTTCARRRECVASCVALSALVLVTIVPYSPITYSRDFWYLRILWQEWLERDGLGILAWHGCECLWLSTEIAAGWHTFDHVLISLAILDVVCFLAEVTPTINEKFCTAQRRRKWTISRRSTWKRWSVACNASCLTVAEPLCHYVNSFE